MIENIFVYGIIIHNNNYNYTKIVSTQINFVAKI